MVPCVNASVSVHDGPELCIQVRRNEVYLLGRARHISDSTAAALVGMTYDVGRYYVSKSASLSK